MVCKSARAIKNIIYRIAIFFSGKALIEARAPWMRMDTKDSLGRPWMTLPARDWAHRVWYPCKDHQSDEPDNGASYHDCSDTLMAIANGSIVIKKINRIERLPINGRL